MTTTPQLSPLTVDDLAGCVGDLTQRLAALPAARWSQPAGTLSWSVAQTVDHLVDGFGWLALQTVEPRCGRVRVDVVVHAQAPEEDRIGAVQAAHHLLRAVLARTPADHRIWHPFGITDASGILAMAVAETMLHGHDVGVLDLGSAPVTLAHRIIDRLLPDHAGQPDPWDCLLWATGRLSLPGRADVTSWQWQVDPRPAGGPAEALT